MSVSFTDSKEGSLIFYLVFANGSFHATWPSDVEDADGLEEFIRRVKQNKNATYVCNKGSPFTEIKFDQTRNDIAFGVISDVSSATFYVSKDIALEVLQQVQARIDVILCELKNT